MYFEQVNKNKLRVQLSRQDLMDFGVTYDTMDYSDPATREMIREILYQARLEYDFHAADSRLLIEACPHEEGGCLLLFTAVPSLEKPMPHSSQFGPVVYRFTDIDTVIEGSIRLFRLCCHRIYKSSLYRVENSYQMILYPLDRAGSRSSTLLAEYGEKTGEGPAAAALVEEHGTPIILNNAIDKLSYYFSQQ